MVKGLASTALPLDVKSVASDWQHCYGNRSVLMETLVDCKRFKGTCHKVANYVHIGNTTGSRRMDGDNMRQIMAVKEIYVCPPTFRFRQQLVGLQKEEPWDLRSESLNTIRKRNWPAIISAIFHARNI